MRYLIIGAMAIMLSGCINIYGPVKARGNQQASGRDASLPGMSDVVTSTLIGNRQPDELINAVRQWFQQEGLTPEVDSAALGIVASDGDDEINAGLWLDCSQLPQTQNIQQQYRIVAQVWSAGEGSNVAVSVTGIAGLVTADGNDKVKPVECKSTGLFDKDLLERLRK